MIKVGVTGQSGFIGKYLYNMLGLFPHEFVRIEFEKCFFEDSSALDAFVRECDVIVHLAGMNRHNDPRVIYQANIELAQKLIASLERTGGKPYVLFSSSTHEDRDNSYGKSKRESRRLLSNWANKVGGIFTGLIIPNVFGPFGNPYYNSVVTTFCHKLTNNEKPKIETDAMLKLIYVGELVNIILERIRKRDYCEILSVEATCEIRVSEILSLLEGYKEQYQVQGIIPQLGSQFELNLFNTFRCYMDIENYFPIKHVQHSDSRGAFMEVIRLSSGGQVSFSTTFPGITRGNHFHTHKIERFSVISGEAQIQLRQIGTDKVINFHLNGESPAYVDIPVWFTHNIKNVGKKDLFTIFWISEFYDPDDPDTYFENV